MSGRKKFLDFHTVHKITHLEVVSKDFYYILQFYFSDLKGLITPPMLFPTFSPVKSIEHTSCQIWSCQMKVAMVSYGGSILIATFPIRRWFALCPIWTMQLMKGMLYLSAVIDPNLCLRMTKDRFYKFFLMLLLFGWKIAGICFIWINRKSFVRMSSLFSKNKCA